MLTLKDNRNSVPVAYYRHGGKVCTIDYIDEEPMDDDLSIPSQCNSDAYLSERDLSKLSRSYISKPELKHIKKALFSKHGDSLVRGMEEKCLKLYQVAMFELQDRIPKEIHLKTMISPTPLFKHGEKQRSSIGFFGASGAGKSTACSKAVIDLLKIHTELKKNVFLFTRNTEDDPAFKGIKMERVILDEHYISEPLTRDDLENSITIFDDVDSIPDKTIRNLVIDLRHDLLQTGRHINNHIFCTSHELVGRSAKDMISELTTIVLFPKSGLTAGIVRILNNYAGMTTQVVNRLINLDTRCLYIHLKSPLYIVTDHSVILI